MNDKLVHSRGIFVAFVFDTEIAKLGIFSPIPVSASVFFVPMNQSATTCGNASNSVWNGARTFQIFVLLLATNRSSLSTNLEKDWLLTMKLTAPTDCKACEQLGSSCSDNISVIFSRNVHNLLIHSGHCGWHYWSKRNWRGKIWNKSKSLNLFLQSYLLGDSFGW